MRRISGANSIETRPGSPFASALTRQAQLDALGDLKSMIIAAAIIGPEFTLDVLAWLVDTERQRLLPALAAACSWPNGKTPA